MAIPSDLEGATLLGPEYSLRNPSLGLRGRLDELWLSSENAVIIVDTKAGLPKPVPARYAVQLMLYALAALPLMQKHGYKLHPRGFIRWEHDNEVYYSSVEYPSGTGWLRSLSLCTASARTYLNLKGEAANASAMIARSGHDFFWVQQANRLLTVAHLDSPGMTTWLPEDATMLPRLIKAIITKGDDDILRIPDVRGGVLFTDALGTSWYSTVLRHEKTMKGLIGCCMKLLGFPRFTYAIGYWQKLSEREAFQLKKAGGGHVPVTAPLPRKIRIPPVFLQSDLPS